jgi:hypothetical protein
VADRRSGQLVKGGQGPAGRFLRHKSLFVHHDEPTDERIQTDEVLSTCMRHWSALAPLHRWLTDNIQTV